MKLLILGTQTLVFLPLQTLADSHNGGGLVTGTCSRQRGKGVRPEFGDADRFGVIVQSPLLHNIYFASAHLPRHASVAAGGCSLRV